ncbi:hypothetical protein AOPFMNJM_3970 [Methylobacterium jeotgali]|uniref:Uncharacterized protein n=1 Tax=Methylobacterium jeotgali TaxID=381630 RepID=A0ABQ4SZM5_9HYPH|nr:hypothetical protein AOPFMNJM_3970 [Methylobacterium jeotgali]
MEALLVALALAPVTIILFFIFFALLAILIAILFPKFSRSFVIAFLCLTVAAYALTYLPDQPRDVSTTSGDQAVSTSKSLSATEASGDESDSYWSRSLRTDPKSGSEAREMPSGSRPQNGGTTWTGPASAVRTPPTPAPTGNPGRCLLRVEGTTYLDDVCNVSISQDGSFTIGTAEHREGLTYFAIVNRQGDGTMLGFWNERIGATHAQTPLGRLKRNGACWENARASVCAWR